MVDNKKIAFACSTIFLIMSAVCVGADSDNQRYLSSGGPLAQKNNYPNTFHALNASIAFNVLLLLVAFSIWFLLIDITNAKAINIFMIAFCVLYVGRFRN